MPRFAPAGRLGETSIPGDGHQSAGCTLVGSVTRGNRNRRGLLTRYVDYRAPGAAIDGEIIAAAVLLGAVLVVGLATAPTDGAIATSPKIL